MTLTIFIMRELFRFTIPNQFGHGKNRRLTKFKKLRKSKNIKVYVKGSVLNFVNLNGRCRLRLTK